MSEEPLWKSVARSVWSNKWTRVLAFVAIAFAIYNELVLPAINGTIALRKNALELRALEQKTEVGTAPPPSKEEQDRAVCASPEGRRMFPAVKCPQ